MRGLCLVWLLACDLNEDPCEQLADYSETYNQGYNDGLTCAGYHNPYSDEADSDPSTNGDSGITADEALTAEESNTCLWSAYDQGFSTGRAGADCSAGLD